MNPKHQFNPSSGKSNAASSTSKHACESVPSQIMIPTPNELVSLLSRRVIGQGQAKQSIAVAVYQLFMNCAGSNLLGGRVEVENNVLLIGPTGCGKSLLLRSLGEILPIPMFVVPCTNITPDGYKGKNFFQHLDSITEVIVDGSKTKPAMVVWDACDKLSIQSKKRIRGASQCLPQDDPGGLPDLSRWIEM